MIILTDKMLVIPVGISPNYSGTSGKPYLEDKSVEITENGDYNYTASEHYDGIGNFNVKVNVEGHYESNKTVNPSFEEDVTVLPSEGFDAMSSVIVKKAEANLQDKTVDKASTSEIVLTADEGYQGLGTVTIAPIMTITNTVIPTSDPQLITADTNNNEYISEVLVNGVPQRTLTVDPSTMDQEFNSNHLYGEFYSKVVVNPVTSSIDSNIVPKNIAKGVRILGVTGTLDASSGDAPLPSELQEIINKGPAYSSKIKVYGVYGEDKRTAYDARRDRIYDAGGVSGYIPFFQKNVKYDANYNNGYPSNDTLANSLGTLADRGIVAYTVNGVLYTNPNSFNIPYTKVHAGSNFYDDVTVDVYIDFTKANARAEIIENAFLSDNGITTPVDSSLFDVNTYRYLPPIYNSNKKEYYYSTSKKIFEYAETYVREQVNALSALFISGYETYSNTGEITFLTGKEGIKRVPDALSQRNFSSFTYVTFYGNVNDFKNLRYWLEESQEFYVYGDINGYDGIFQESTNWFFGNVSTPTGYFKTYNGNFLDKTYDVIDIGENIDANPTEWNGSSISISVSNVALFPNTLKYLYDNHKPYSNYETYYHRKIYVFFGTTPPTMPDVDGSPQLLLQTGSTNLKNNLLTTIYKPAGADYSSILDPTNPPTVIDFTPITSMSEVAGPGIYGLTYGDKGYHWLFEIKESAQGEQDLQTIANELNNL